MNSRTRFLHARIVFLGVLLISPVAIAQETLPGAVCDISEEHRVRQVGGPENPGTGYTLVCDGANWKLVNEWDTGTGKSLFQVDNDTDPCTTTKTGRLAYNNGTDTWNYCDGANWLELGGDLWTDSGAGYIQYSSSLGGIQVGNVPALSVPVPADTGAALIAIIEDRKPSGTSGGASSQGSWQTRDLNTITFNDSDGRVSLSANQFTLTPEGTETFLIYAGAPALDVQGHQARLRNITDTATVAPGTSQYTRTDAVNYSNIRTAVTISSPKTFEIQHYTEDNQNPGLGRAAGFGEQEIYTRVIIMRQ